MALSTIEKAVKLERALRQLRSELSRENMPNQSAAINHFLIHANDDSKARLYDIMTKERNNLTPETRRITGIPTFDEMREKK